MSAPAAAFAAAEALVGTPFRLHGRNPETGLDCVGLVGAALTASGRRVRYPFGYRLRNATIHRWLGFAKANGLLDMACLASPCTRAISIACSSASCPKAMSRAAPSNCQHASTAGPR